jgi:hypothetical protein
MLSLGTAARPKRAELPQGTGRAGMQLGADTRGWHGQQDTMGIHPIDPDYRTELKRLR